MVGRIEFRIEYERRGDRVNDTGIAEPGGISASPPAIVFLWRPGRWSTGVEHDSLPGRLAAGRLECRSRQALREAENRNAPEFALRAVAPDSPVDRFTPHAIRWQMHSNFV